MEKLLEIRDEDIGLEKIEGVKFNPRVASRAILMKGGNIALLHVSKHGYYKLPGGGVDKGETLQQALRREVAEEVGCSIKIIGSIGKIIEYRNAENKIQTSYCFLAKIEKEGEQNLEDGEIADGFRLVWATLEEAINLLKVSRPKTYDGNFIVKRDLCFLQKAQSLLKTSSI